MIFFRLLYSWPYNFFKKLNIFLDKKQSKFQSILIALSGNSNDYKSVQIAKNLIEKKSGTLTFVHVLEIDLKTPLDAEINEQTIHGDKILSSTDILVKTDGCWGKYPTPFLALICIGFEEISILSNPYV